MNNINRLFLVIAIAILGQYAVAQPPARKRENSEKQESTTYNIPMTERAKSQYPKSEVPQEVVWKRDLYRVLDLEKEKNAALYYPVEPIGNNMNLFTYIFRLILDNSITAYAYNLDGYESFTPDNKVNPQDMLDNYRIYYESGDNNSFIVGTSDIPSGEVLSYYIKESYYFDQRTATYNHRVTAICPVLHRSELSSEVTKYPMFWLNYDEIAPLLARQPVMTSSYNNVSSMSLDDYFTKHSYEGEIYKTVNLRNLAISQYCKDSTEIKKEQEKIEKQLADFEANLWNSAKKAEEQPDDSAAVADKKEKKSTKKAVAKKSTNKEKSVKSSSKSSNSTNSGNGAARVSVRRQRR
ncbi:MAG: gliding motility protein GldN [Bacteroidaceae bacterium]|nr:gliding motility protein GldN [Bacteroidaceae bacterium]